MQKAYMAQLREANYSIFAWPEQTTNAEVFTDIKRDLGLSSYNNELFAPSGASKILFGQRLSAMVVSPVGAGVYGVMSEFGASDYWKDNILYTTANITALGSSIILPRAGVTPLAGTTTLKTGSDLQVVGSARNPATLGQVNGSYSMVKPGPLSNDISGTFSGGKYTVVTLSSDTILYRAGTTNQPLGQFFSLDAPLGVLQTRIDKAVLPVWPGGGKSPIDTAFQIKVPAGTTVYMGNVGSQGGVYVGGTKQIFVPKPWQINGVDVMNSSKLK